jgi:hypothetical protein
MTTFFYGRDRSSINFLSFMTNANKARKTHLQTSRMQKSAIFQARMQALVSPAAFPRDCYQLSLM